MQQRKLYYLFALIFLVLASGCTHKQAASQDPSGITFTEPKADQPAASMPAEPKVDESATSEPTEASTDAQIVYTTRTGECYHTDGCRSLRRSKIETTASEAKERGYRACSVCSPPE